MALEQYRNKRDPERTPEPFGRGDASSAVFSKSGGMFVIQKHAATRLHYDFRLAMEGVLRSWAVPKGPSLDPREKRLAVFVEDHPIDYGDFEGVIPRDNYGAGEVIVWDRGIYKVIDPPNGDAAECVRNGKLDIEMHGFKMRGAYTLVRTHLTDGGKSKQENWLLIKKRDQYANEDEDLIEAHPRSIFSGLTIEEMRDTSAIGREISAQLEKQRLDRLSGVLNAKSFPLTLAKPHESAFDGDAWLYEIKYDGVRILAIRDGTHVRLFARSGTEVTERYPEVTLAFDAMPFDRFVIDGEIVALMDDGRPNFGMLQTRMHVSDPATARKLSFSTPTIDFVFDLLAFDGFDLRAMPLEKRKETLHQIVRGEGPIRYCDHIVGRGKDFFQAVAQAGLEGIIAKRRESKYRGARSDDWLKIKAPLTKDFVIAGYTSPDGARNHFGALLLGVYEDAGQLRYVGKVGTGFNGDTLKSIHDKLKPIEIEASPFRIGKDLVLPEKRAHFVEPNLVASVRFGELTSEGCVRHPSFMKLVDDADPRDCTWEAAFGGTGNTPSNTEQTAMPLEEIAPSNGGGGAKPRDVTITHPDKVFWPKEGYTKADLVDYYRKIARWMLPYLKDRPVMIVRYPDGIEGKSFYQKDAPAFAPEWIRTVTIYSHDSQRDINYFVVENEDALAYLANLATIPIHIWSSRIGSVENPDWLLFDLDPKGSTTEKAVHTARETVKLLSEIGLKSAIKTSGQMGIHVMVGLKPIYTYQQARDFSEIVARLVVARIPDVCTIERNKAVRNGKVYIDYLQLGHGKTIAAPYTVRPNPRAPVSSPVRVAELKPDLDPESFTIKNMAARMMKMKTDPFLGAITDQQRLEPSLKILSEKYSAAGLG
jgi:bifunctional non-homologous end joining protein LigD